MIITLERVKDGTEALVREIQGGRTLRHRLARRGVHPGDKLRLVRTGHFGGPVLIEVHGAEVAIGRGMAQKIVLEVSESS